MRDMTLSVPSLCLRSAASTFGLVDVILVFVGI